MQISISGIHNHVRYSIYGRGRGVLQILAEYPGSCPPAVLEVDVIHSKQLILNSGNNRQIAKDHPGAWPTISLVSNYKLSPDFNSEVINIELTATA